jgi:hypothetical protein
MGCGRMLKRKRKGASGDPFSRLDGRGCWLQELMKSRCRDGCRDQRVALQVAVAGADGRVQCGSMSKDGDTRYSSVQDRTGQYESPAQRENAVRLARRGTKSDRAGRFPLNKNVDVGLELGAGVGWSWEAARSLVELAEKEAERNRAERFLLSFERFFLLGEASD